MPKDLFSNQAGLYAQYRPGYPAGLIEYILSFVPNRIRAWDCATGNGQAAVLLAPYFEKVEATDISEKQISQSIADPAITYSIAEAEKTQFADDSFDLITVAQSYHWFRFDEFFREATRTGKPGSVIAVWGYGLIETGNGLLEKAIRHFYVDVVGKYWDRERKYVDEKYRTVPFAFKKLPSKEFSIVVSWNTGDMVGYLNTWSSVQHYKKANGINPVDEFAGNLKNIWGESDLQSFSFPLFLLLGRNEK